SAERCYQRPAGLHPTQDLLLSAGRHVRPGYIERGIAAGSKRCLCHVLVIDEVDWVTGVHEGVMQKRHFLLVKLEVRVNVPQSACVRRKQGDLAARGLARMENIL